MGLKLNPITGNLDLVGSSSGSTSDSFTIIQVPNGTSPVADSSTDTLTFTSTDSTITVTGNSTTDTVNFAARAASATVSGIVSTSSQTFAGTKTFNDGIVIGTGGSNYIRTGFGAASTPLLATSVENTSGIFFDTGGKTCFSVSSTLRAQVDSTGILTQNITPLTNTTLTTNVSTSTATSIYNMLYGPALTNDNAHPGDKILNYISASWTHAATAANPTFITQYLDSNYSVSGSGDPAFEVLRIRSTDGGSMLGSRMGIRYLGGTAGSTECFGVFDSGDGYFSGTLTLGSIKIPAGASSGYVMTSDGSGVGSWAPQGGFSFNSPLNESGGTVTIGQATGASDGYLSQSDFSFFYNAATSAITSANSPLSVGGGSISIGQSGSGSDGYLSSTDWNNFNSKDIYNSSGPWWQSGNPTNTDDAINRIASFISSGGGSPIP